MKGLLSITAVVLLYVLFALSSCAVQEEKAVTPVAPAAPPPAAKASPAEAKAKPIKAEGDVGLLDLEKNYMILVTKEGKLITVDFNQKTKVTQVTPTDSKMEDVGLGSTVTADYQTKGEKKVATRVEYKAAKAGD